MLELLPEERSTFKDFLTERFSIGELEDIVFDLGISYESFPHDTREQFARELFLYCERRDMLGYLVVEMLRRRTEAQQVFGEIIRKLKFLQPRKKIQIIMPIDALTISRERLAEMIALLCKNITPEDVVVLATAPDYSQALIGLPAEAAGVLIQSTRNELPSSIHQIVDFDSLSVEHQRNWKSLVVKLKPEQTQIIAKAGNLVVNETIYTIQQIVSKDTSHEQVES
jgi:hypothetical protein